MKSQRGRANLPRYFITVGDDIIFDYPEQFIQDTNDLISYPYINSISDISELIREYIDTPTDDLFDKNFVKDKFKLTEILKAADKRIGQRRLDELLLKTDCEAAKAIIAKRKSNGKV